MSDAVPLSALTRRHLAERPNATALIEGERAVSFAEFDALCGRTAAWLSEHGVRKGDRVGVWLVNRVEWLALLFGLARLGATLVSVNTRYRSAELEYLLSKSGTRMLVLQPDFRGIDFPAVLRGVSPDAVPALETVAVVGSDAGRREDAVLERPVVRFAPDEARKTPQDAADPEAPVILFTTSGTTKGPKLVVHVPRTLVYHSRRAARAYGFEEPGAKLLAALPLCGVFGLNSALAAFAAGAPIILMPAFDGPGVVELVRRHEVTHVFGSDEMYRRIGDATDLPAPFPSARRFGFAAFHPGVEAFARTLTARGFPLVGLYGSSEVQALFSLQPQELPLDRRIEGGGAPAAGGEAEIRIRDVESGALLPPGRSGEIEIKAPSNFVGYLDDPDATAQAVGPDGFFRTGDLGRLREDGTFVYETRMGDAMRIGGFMVSPVEIEDAVKAVPGIHDAQAVSVEIGGQPRPVVFAIPDPGAPVDEAAVIGTVRGRIAGFKVPARVWFVAQFPTTESANGVKIQRAKLRSLAMERLQAGD